MAVNSPAKHTVVILDDHELFGASLAMMLEHNGFADAAYSFTDPLEVRRFIIKHTEGHLYLFLDYYIPDVNALQFINDVLRLNGRLHIIMVSSLVNADIIKRIMTYNVSGFLTKTAGFKEVNDCFNAIKRKQVYISPAIQKILDDSSENSLIAKFTGKEIELLDKLAKGETIEQMATSLNISRNTVIVHRRNMLAKTGCKSVMSLLALAVKAGIISSSGTGV